VELDVSQHAAGPAGPVFYFDLASPEAYLSAERILPLMPVATEWVPVLAAELPAGGPPQPRGAEESEALWASIAERAAALGLQPVRRPDPFPADTRTAMLAATFAKQIGRVVAFSLAAFRQAFAGGHDLGEPDVVLIAGSACEMHPAAILKAVDTETTRRALAEATALAADRGVRGVPAVWVPGTGEGPGRVFHGDAALDLAAAAAQPLRPEVA
jgi:2-hydroxychromene-2-carboxylate isomerase